MAAWVARADSRATSALVFGLVGLGAGDDTGLGELGVAGGVALVVFGLGGIAGEGGFRLGDLRAVAGDVGFGLAEGFFVGTRVDLEEEIALGDVLAFGEADAEQLAGDLRLDLHDGGGLHGADHSQFGRHGFLRGFGDGDRDDGQAAGPLAVWAALAAAQGADTGRTIESRWYDLQTAQ